MTIRFLLVQEPSGQQIVTGGFRFPQRRVEGANHRVYLCKGVWSICGALNFAELFLAEVRSRGVIE